MISFIQSLKINTKSLTRNHDLSINAKLVFETNFTYMKTIQVELCHTTANNLPDQMMGQIINCEVETEFKSITSRNNAPISNYGSGFRCKSEYPWCIIEFSKKSRKTKKKMTKKREFLRKSSFRPNRFFYMVEIQKLITTIEIFNFSNSNLYEICQNCENLQIILWLENLTPTVAVSSCKLSTRHCLGLNVFNA
ncbi:hypothetical protein AGLY_017532 [Aphis glycines]|uniref:Uncharacterized protein n=1 Tax=Aphis glycines TaxID=307491 RepID=A0A6G0SUK4_APHGL|nr:hypothetical protein AGLY_017532 [Aphis glycines]